MNRCKKEIIYNIHEIPDPAFSGFIAISGGNVKQTIWQGWEHILHTISNMPASSVSVEILYVFEPLTKQTDNQNRLKIYLRLTAIEPEILKSLEHLIVAGTLSRFYDFSCVDNASLIMPDTLKHTCLIVRREDFIKPLYSNMFNPKIPDYYYTLSPLESNDNNDFLMLDRVLDKLSESVVISIKAEPVDVSKELHAFNRYLENLISINRCYDSENDLSSSWVDQLFSVKDDIPGFCSSTESLDAFNFRDPHADDILRLGRKIHESLRKPNLKFQVSISTQSGPIAHLCASVIAESAFKNGSYRLCGGGIDSKMPLWSDSGKSFPELNGDITEYDDLRRLIQCATVNELIGIVHFPVASFSSPFCIRKNTDPPSIAPDDLIILGYDIHGGGIPRGFPVNAITKHFINLGSIGQGKTTSNTNILIQLWKRGIPCLIIESVKKEYRRIKRFLRHKDPSIRKLARDLQVYTADSQASPFDFNPLDFQPSTTVVEEHIENLLSCFKASIPVSAGSLPALIGEALELVYERFQDPERPPNISDLITTLSDVLGSKGYSSEIHGNILTAIEVRLGILTQNLIGNVFGCKKGLQIHDLLRYPCLIEMDRLTVEQKCLLTLFILSAIREALRGSLPDKGPVKFVILIEEAHNIFGSLTNHSMSDDTADPRLHVAEFLSQMMVELRALGVGIIISDQHPSNLASGAIKTPVSKQTFLQVDRQDRELLGSSMLFNDIEMQDIARLCPGEAFFFTEGYHYPRRIRTVNLHERLNLSDPLSDQELHELISKEDWYKAAATRRLEDKLSNFGGYMDQFSLLRERLNQEIQKCIVLREQYKVNPDHKARNKAMDTIISNLRMKKRKFRDNYKKFNRRVKKKYECLRNQQIVNDGELQVYRETLFERLDNSLIPRVEELLEFLDKTIKTCIKSKI